MCQRLQREKGKEIVKIVRIQSDHVREFENSSFLNCYSSKGMSYEFSTPITPKNGVVKRKNRTLH